MEQREKWKTRENFLYADEICIQRLPVAVYSGFVLILTGVIANVQGTMFTKNLIDDYITPFLLTDSPDFGPLAQAIGRVAVFYAVGVVATYLYNRIMVNVTQGTLRNLRNELFEHMETLPIKYFDTHAHGDIMSVYTNDIDTLRQMISQSIPQIINSGITIISVFISMLILNIPLTWLRWLWWQLWFYARRHQQDEAEDTSWNNR